MGTPKKGHSSPHFLPHVYCGTARGVPNVQGPVHLSPYCSVMIHSFGRFRAAHWKALGVVDWSNRSRRSITDQYHGGKTPALGSEKTRLVIRLSRGHRRTEADGPGIASSRTKRPKDQDRTAQDAVLHADKSLVSTGQSAVMLCGWD